MFLILLGLTFLLREVGCISYHVVAIVWPVIMILAGLQFLLRGMCSKTESK